MTQNQVASEPHLAVKFLFGQRISITQLQAPANLRTDPDFTNKQNTKHAEIIIAHSDLSLHSVPITKLSPLPFSWQGSGQIKGVGNKLRLLSMTTQVRPATDSLWLQYIFRLKKNIVEGR